MLKKGLNGLLATDAQSEEFLRKIKHGQIVRAEVKRVRNLKFHRKFFALLNVAFEAWTPEIKVYAKTGEVAVKNFDRFRSDVTILAGFYEATYKINGEMVLKPKSISFSNMDETEFQDLYSKVIDVILERILTNYTKDDLEQVVNEVLGFV